MLLQKHSRRSPDQFSYFAAPRNRPNICTCLSSTYSYISTTHLTLCVILICLPRFSKYSRFLVTILRSRCIRAATVIPRYSRMCPGKAEEGVSSPFCAYRSVWQTRRETTGFHTQAPVFTHFMIPRTFSRYIPVFTFKSSLPNKKKSEHISRVYIKIEFSIHRYLHAYIRGR